MIEKDYVESLKRFRRFPRTFDDYKWYALLIAPLGVALIGYAMFESFRKAYGINAQLLLPSMFIMLGLAFTFIFIRRFRQNVTFSCVELNAEIDIDCIAQRLKDKFRLSGLQVSKEIGMIQAHTKATAFSWGEQLTIIVDENCVLMNSRPNGVSQPFTLLKDSRNVRKLKQIIRQATLPTSACQNTG